MKESTRRKLSAIAKKRWAERRKAAAAPAQKLLDDGTLLIPQSDDEGNDAGALGIQAGSKTRGIPRLAPVI